MNFFRFKRLKHISDFLRAFAALFLFLNNHYLAAIEFKGSIYSETAFREPTNSSLNPDNLHSLNDLQYFLRGNVSLKSDFGATAKGFIKLESQYLPISYVSDEAEESLFIKEMFIDILGRFFTLRTGKQYIKWGSGIFFNPLDIVNLKRDPLRPLDEAEGSVFTQLAVPFGSSLMADFIIPFEQNNSSENNSTGRDLPLIARVSFSSGGLSGFAFSMVQNRAEPVYGLNSEYTFSFLSGVSLAAYGECTYKTESSTKKVIRNNGAYELAGLGRNEYIAYVTGASLLYFFPEKKRIELIGLNAEYYYNNENWSHDEYALYDEYLRFVSYDPALHLQAVSLYRQFGVAYRYLYLAVSFNGLFVEDLNFSAGAVANLEDKSILYVPNLSYSLNDNNTSIGIRAYLYREPGTAGISEFGNLPEKYQTMLYMQTAF